MSESKCQRAKVNGALLIIMPKLNAMENAITLRGDQRATQKAAAAGAITGVTGVTGGGRGTAATQKTGGGATSSQRTVLKPKKLSLQEQMMQEAMQQAGGGAGSAGAAEGRNNELLDSNIGAATSRGAVNVSNIVPRKEEKPLAATSEPTNSVFKMSNRVVELD